VALLPFRRPSLMDDLRMEIILKMFLAFCGQNVAVHRMITGNQHKEIQQGSEL
jgi:hypothetical protein